MRCSVCTVQRLASFACTAAGAAGRGRPGRPEAMQGPAPHNAAASRPRQSALQRQPGAASAGEPRCAALTCRVPPALLLLGRLRGCHGGKVLEHLRLPQQEVEAPAAALRLRATAGAAHGRRRSTEACGWAGGRAATAQGGGCRKRAQAWVLHGTAAWVRPIVLQDPRAPSGAHLALAGVGVLLQAHALQLLAADLVLLLQALALLACHLARRRVEDLGAGQGKGDGRRAVGRCRPAAASEQ